VSCAKMAEQIEMLFGFWTRVGRMKWRRCGLMSNYMHAFISNIRTITASYNVHKVAILQ